MEHGDISNRLPPRWLIVFEGVIGEHPQPTDRAAFEFYSRAHAWRHTVNSFQLNRHSSKTLWDLTWRRDFKFDVVTYLPRGCVKHVETWLTKYSVPVANVWHREDAAAMGRDLAYMPDVFAVVHANPAHRFTYGDRGVLVTDKWTV